MAKIFKQWIYHKTKEPKVIDSNDFEAQEAMGWADSPASFITIADFGADGDDPKQVQQLGEAIQGVRDAANGALNLDIMSKKELETYAKKHFDIDLDRRKKAKDLRESVKTMVGM
tara:strand:+ start:124 stop:468 length:345 start_codon:yes stop_codon:yes gene_type:complete